MSWFSDMSFSLPLDPAEVCDATFQIADDS